MNVYKVLTMMVRMMNISMHILQWLNCWLVKKNLKLGNSSGPDGIR